jgi:hypothetical protein
MFIALLRGRSGEPLERQLRDRYERRLGVDLSHVRVLSGAIAASLARSRCADAFAVGATGMIVLGDTASRSPQQREALIAHELVHVAQAVRAGHAVTDPDREAEARAVEREALAPAAPGASREEIYTAIRTRVLELVDEADRLSGWRAATSG